MDWYQKIFFFKIEIALAGRARNDSFGKSEITQCSINDISYATNILEKWLQNMDFQLLVQFQWTLIIMKFLGDGLFRRKPLIADNTSSKIDNEIIKISKISLNNSIAILKKNEFY